MSDPPDTAIESGNRLGNNLLQNTHFTLVGTMSTVNLFRRIPTLGMTDANMK